MPKSLPSAPVVSYSTARGWFHLAGFPAIRGSFSGRICAVAGRNTPFRSLKSRKTTAPMPAAISQPAARVPEQILHDRP